MKRIFLINIIIIILTAVGFTQSFELGIGSGIGTYTMTDLKNLNNKISANFPFETRLVSNFPPYWFYSPFIIVKGNNFGFGVCYSFKSTGSRISSKDYSGEYRFDMTIYSNSPCFYLKYDIPIYYNINLGIYSKLGLNYSNLKMNEFLEVNNTILTNTSNKFDFQNEFYQPGFEMDYKYNIIGIKFDIGYLFQFTDGIIISKSNSENNSNLGVIKPTWNGCRIGLSFFIDINSVNKR